jgi:hypothetical protein|tara:strand:- start:294 stop:635 length:342 start_codon:yes stop_codon:yes gene_type:complete
MASPKTIRERLRVEKIAAEVQAECEARYAKTHPSLPRTSRRHMAGTKGLPFSRCKLIDTTPAQPGKPAVFHLKHPTRGTGGVFTKTATPQLLRTFFPSLPDNLAAFMLGRTHG